MSNNGIKRYASQQYVDNAIANLDLGGDSSKVIYDNSTSGLTATNVNDAINELAAKDTTILEQSKTYTDEKVAAEETARNTAISDAITNLVGLAPEERNTIEELAKAIEEHEDVTDAINSAIVNKVDKVEGKGLSTNDFTDELKAKYDGMCENRDIFDGIYLRDIENGYLYLVQMKGGTLVSSSKTVSIQVSKEPDKMIYNVGEAFDPTGMIVSTVCEDGTQKIITNYTCSDMVDNVVTITYTEGKDTYTTTVSVTVKEITSIRVDQMPNKVEYTPDEAFDPTGMIVFAVYSNGTTEVITDYTCSDIVDGVVTITYINGEDTFTTTVSVTVNTIESELVDFEYTKNEDGTYTLNAWKGTLNGVSSTEMVFPDSELIIM